MALQVYAHLSMFDLQTPQYVHKFYNGLLKASQLRVYLRLDGIIFYLDKPTEENYSFNDIVKNLAPIVVFAFFSVMVTLSAAVALVVVKCLPES